jgi:hypothetical protein
VTSAGAALTVALVWLGAAPAAGAGQGLADWLAAARPTGTVPAFENRWVRVHYALLDFPEPPSPPPATPPVVLFVRVRPGPEIVNDRLLLGPRRAQPGLGPPPPSRGVEIELLAPVPPPPSLGLVGAALPRDVVEEGEWDGGRLVVATFAPLRYGAGTGGYASVAVFLSEGIVEVTERGVRRRMAVAAGDTFWFEAATRLTVIDDDPVGVAIVQLWPPR